MVVPVIVATVVAVIIIAVVAAMVSVPAIIIVMTVVSPPVVISAPATALVGLGDGGKNEAGRRGDREDAGEVLG
jgi:hypothetical protein